MDTQEKVLVAALRKISSLMDDRSTSFSIEKMRRHLGVACGIATEALERYMALADEEPDWAEEQWPEASKEPDSGGDLG